MYAPLSRVPGKANKRCCRVCVSFSWNKKPWMNIYFNSSMHYSVRTKKYFRIYRQRTTPISICANVLVFTLYLNERHRVWLNNLDLLCSQWAPIFPQGLRLLKAVILQPCVHKVHKTYAIEWDGALIWEEEEKVTYYIYLVIYIPVRASKLDLSSYLVIVQ